MRGSKEKEKEKETGKEKETEKASSLWIGALIVTLAFNSEARAYVRENWTIAVQWLWDLPMYLSTPLIAFMIYFSMGMIWRTFCAVGELLLIALRDIGIEASQALKKTLKISAIIALGGLFMFLMYRGLGLELSSLRERMLLWVVEANVSRFRDAVASLLP